MSLLHFLIPWEPSALLVAFFVITSALYLRGARRARVSMVRQSAFWSGLVLFYVALHTRVDYYAEHEFFAHRLQHLVLHHLAPLLVMAAYPGSALRAGLPIPWRTRLRAVAKHSMVRALAKVCLQPTLISLLFVASVLIWLIPSVQFISMINWRLYLFMNWSVAVTGLLYWWLLLDHRPAPPARLGAGLRVLSPLLTMTPQILAGAIIAFTQRDLYPIFDLCGRAFGLPALTDQSIGGLIMWVPASFLEGIGGLLALRHWTRLSQKARPG
ncbi:cytochrome c oxidase assembly protein [Mycoavidus cysteinexigens]|nr:cytochrome c oxidase assembly protein [Mycoavidus cysteinexigens]GAM52914.1 inner membrane protein [bacterium endosymbiont of Mortierella elongata FMR23-6]